MDKKVYEFISDKSGEKIVEWKKCCCGEDFAITDKDLEFYEKISPIFNGKKYLIPTPTLCPDCMQQRKMIFRNERNLYSRKCDLSGKNIISVHSPDKPYKVYDQKEWWSDKWSPLEYGQDFDFSKGFFEQFNNLVLKVPQQSLIILDSENSEYGHNTIFLKDSYLCFGVSESENVYYSTLSTQLKDCVDSSFSIYSNNCYYITDCISCYQCYFSLKCTDSTRLTYCYDCVGCSDCYFSFGLRNKKHNILNVQYSEKDYNNKLKEILTNKEKYIDLYKVSSMDLPRISMYLVCCENSFGNIVFNCKNSVNSFDSIGLEYCKNVNNSGGGVDSRDSYGLTKGSELSYEGINIGGYNCCFSIEIDKSNYILYSKSCHDSSNLFGCVGLRNKEYCILNKQYTKEKYEELVPKIIESMIKNNNWGEFFPISMATFGYNETVASEYYPLSKDEAISKGFKWSDYEVPFPKVSKTIPASKLPESIKDIPDDILNWAIECEVSGKPFRIIKQELEFYRKHNLPVPRRHPDVRHMDRMNKRAPRKLFLKNCDKCGIEMISVYDKNSEYKVYCEECYSKEVV